MSREDFEGIAKWAKENHKKRIEKNPERIKYAIKQFEKNNIEYVLKDEKIGHFHCYRKKDDKLFQFYASTGKIMGLEARGIHNLIKILNEK